MNYDHTARKLLITGKSGSGKTTLFLQTLRGWRARWKFCFDPDLEAARKLGWLVCRSVEQMNWCVVNCRPVCFEPSTLFPGDRGAAFAFFSRYALAVAAQVPGPKVLACDEVWRYVPAMRTVPQPVQILFDEGRKFEVDLLLVAQRPNKLHDALRASLTEIVSFRHSDALPLKWLAEDFDPEIIKVLAYPGGYVRKSLVK